MINHSPEDAIKDIFERAATSLSRSRDQLDKTRKALKKAVLRLSASINSNDVQVNAVLSDIKTSVDINIDLHILNSQLDKLFVLTNNSSKKNKTSAEAGFSLSLQKALAETSCSETCVATINALVDKHLSDSEMALEILRLINRDMPDGSQEELSYQSLAEK